jgi:RNA polymerase sigma factor (sigma-70 family)
MEKPERIFEQVQPIIEKFIHRKFSNPKCPDADDLRQEVYVDLLKQLRERERDPHAQPIRDLNAYVRQIVRTTWHQYLARKYPQRYRLKNKLRHFLKTQPGFALWDDEDDLICGFAVWRDQRIPFDQRRRYRQMLDDPRAVLSDKAAARMNWADLLEAIFNHVGSPMELDDLVKIVAELKGIIDLPDQPLQKGDGAEGEEVLRAPQSPVDAHLFLKECWSKILLLSLRQRAAMLLNLRDGKGGSALELLWLGGIASKEQVADAVGMSIEEFGSILDDLPLDDLKIAARLGITRQQVINLRKAARERLCRLLGYRKKE